MSQPPQNGWGQPPSEDPYGQSSANGGYDAAGQSQPEYGQSYGSQSPADGSYGQDGAYGPASPGGGYGQDASFAPSFGDTGGQAFAPQGAAPKKSNKLPIILCAGCALLVVLLVVVGGGIFLFTRGDGEPTGGGDPTATETTDEPTAEPTDEPTEDPTDEPTEDPTDEPTEDPTEKTTAAPAAGDGDGSKDKPYATGQMFTLEDGEGGTLDVTVGAVNWDGTAAVMEANQFNEEPGADETYIVVPVTMTYHGDGTAEPFLAVTIDYVSGGNTYSDEGTVTEKSAYDVGTLHDGGTAEFEIGIIVPKDKVKDGLLTADVLFNFDAQPVWVAAG